MNWVGGSRSRIILKQERRKQKEFFEKKKLKSKMKLLGVSSPKSSAVSLDLLNLYVVNQISTKKDNPASMRKPVHIDITEDVKIPARRHNIELPTSPLHTQRMPNLDDIQNRLQKQVLDSRRQHLSEKKKCQHNLPQATELTYADFSMECEDSTASAFSACPLSSSVCWSSNCTQLSEENLNTNLMGNTWGQSYEEKLQTQPGNSSDQDPWVTGPPSQCIFRKSDTVPQEPLKPLHRCLSVLCSDFVKGQSPDQAWKKAVKVLEAKLDYMIFSRKNPVIMTGNESEDRKGIKDALFDVVKETSELKPKQDGSDCSFLALFEDESKPININPPTKHFNLFVNQSSTDLFFMDPDDRKEMTNKNYPYYAREAYPAINDKESSVDRHLEGVFTAPEQVLLKSNTVLSASYEKSSELHNTHLQDCHEGQHYFIASEEKGTPSNLEKIETSAYHHDQWINLQESVQNYSRQKSDDESVGESAWRQNQLFGFEELPSRFSDVESSLSSQSPSYSPRQTESCFSSSPDMSEEEDTAQKMEYRNERSLKEDDANLASASTEPPKTSHTGTVPLQPSSILTREEAHHPQEKNSTSCAPEEENKAHTAPPEGSSLHKVHKGEPVTRSSRRDVWVQTEGSVIQVGKVDAATQCGPIPMCSCGRSLPSAPSTAEGHKMPAQEELQPPSSGAAAAPTAFSPETEDLSSAGRTTLEVLNYTDTVKEREKQ
ncbi:regulator of DNA class I crossover intermediates 1 [Amazona ochrocephala]